MTSARLVSILANPAPICAYIGAIWRLFKSPANGTAGASENCPSMGDINLKRAYEPASPDDVDRLWPRRLSRDHANIDQWLKEVAPSDVLCKWFSHDPANGASFAGAMRRSCRAARRCRNCASSFAKSATIPAVCGDREHNNAVALKGLLARD